MAVSTVSVYLLGVNADMSRSWTKGELEAAANYMRQHGDMGYEEFCVSLAAGKFKEKTDILETEIDTSDAMLALAYSSTKAEADGISDMTLDEIAAEIEAVRNSRFAAKPPAAEEFEASLNHAQEWALSVGYAEGDVDGIIKSVRRKQMCTSKRKM